METLGLYICGNSIYISRFSPTLSVMREMLNEHLTYIGTGAKNNSLCIKRPNNDKGISRWKRHLCDYSK